MRKSDFINMSIVFAVGLMFSMSSSADAQTCAMDATLTSSGINIPAKIVQAKEYQIDVTVKNSGTCAWEPSSRIRLSIKIVRGPSGSAMQRDELTPIVELKYKVQPGKTHSFHYTIEGPAYPGNYTLEWIMVMNNKPFGNEIRKSIEGVAK
jgi:hypothetical protein